MYSRHSHDRGMRERDYSHRSMPVYSRRPIHRPEIREKDFLRRKVDDLFDKFSKKGKEILTQQKILEKREKYLKNEILGNSKKRPRENENMDGEPSHQKRKISEDKKNPEDEKKKKERERGKRFMKLLSFQLLRSKTQLKQEKKSSKEILKSDEIARQELKSVEKEKQELEFDKLFSDNLLEKAKTIRDDFLTLSNDFRNVDFLETVSEPKISYLPFKLLPEQSDQIKAKKEIYTKKREEIRERIKEIENYKRPDQEEKKIK